MHDHLNPASLSFTLVLDQDDFLDLASFVGRLNPEAVSLIEFDASYGLRIVDAAQEIFRGMGAAWRRCFDSKYMPHEHTGERAQRLWSGVNLSGYVAPYAALHDEAQRLFHVQQAAAYPVFAADFSDLHTRAVKLHRRLASAWDGCTVDLCMRDSLRKALDTAQSVLDSVVLLDSVYAEDPSIERIFAQLPGEVGQVDESILEGADLFRVEVSLTPDQYVRFAGLLKQMSLSFVARTGCDHAEEAQRLFGLVGRLLCVMALGWFNSSLELSAGMTRRAAAVFHDVELSAALRLPELAVVHRQPSNWFDSLGIEPRSCMLHFLEQLAGKVVSIRQRLEEVFCTGVEYDIRPAVLVKRLGSSMHAAEGLLGAMERIASVYSRHPAVA